MTLDELANRMRAAGHWVSLDLRVNEDAAAELIGVATRTLRDWRARGCAPRYCVAGRLTYRITDVMQFLAERECDPKQLAAAAG